MKQYRRRFIQFNMLFVSFILLVIFVTLSVVISFNQYNELQHTMRQVLMPLGSQAQMDRFDRKSEDGTDAPPTLPETADDRGESLLRRNGEPLHLRLDQTNIVTALYDSVSDDVQIISGCNEIDADGIAAAVQQIVTQEKDFGRLRGAGLFFYRENHGGIVRVALADTGYLTARIVRTLAALALALLAALGLFFAVSVALSKRAAKPMEDAIAMERQFVADVSHDLKTPITVILANNTIMRQSPDTPVREQMQWLDSTDDAAQNMRAMIDRMLTLWTLEEVPQQTELTAVDLSAAAEKSVLQLESVAYERNITLESEIPDTVFAKATADYAERICNSLLENALKYEPDGGRVTVTLTQSKKKVHLSVHNSGSFIAPQDLPHIFERFYRADKTRGETKGHGLGLPILKKITDRIGADISVTSEQAAGTTFLVRFDAATML